MKPISKFEDEVDSQDSDTVTSSEDDEETVNNIFAIHIYINSFF